MIFFRHKIFLLTVWAIICCLYCDAQYKVVYQFKNSLDAQKQVPLKSGFPSQATATAYINTLPKQMQAMGFLAASIDSLQYDKDSVKVLLFLGNPFSFTSISPNAKAKRYLDQANIHWQQKPSPAELQQACEKMLAYFENIGHPFATIMLDSINWKDNDLHAVMKIDETAPYVIDSIHTVGGVNVSQHYLQHYLGVGNRSLYNKSMLSQISQRLRELPFLQESQPWRMDMLSTGGTVDLFLEPKRSSQINVLVGFAPNTNSSGESKLLFTGQATVNLKNALGAGETIGVDWQQLQTQSPRLTLAFQYPYIFNSPYGLDVGFELYKKDSQWVNINSRIGLSYEMNAQQSGKVMLLTSQTNLGYIDTTKIKSTKTLDSTIDVSSVSIGINYQFNNTNYRRNPRHGWDIQLEGSIGTRKIKKNNDIISLKDANDPSFNFNSLYDSIKLSSYQFRFRSSINYYWPLGRLTILKTALQSGWYESPNIFLNEMFQIGGTKILRGFNEESIYANVYNIFTAEFRYLIGANSYFFTFGDGGFTHYRQQNTSFSSNYLGVGVGLAFETGSSLFNLSLAVGKSDAVPFNLQQAKIHLGFINYF